MISDLEKEKLTPGVKSESQKIPQNTPAERAESSTTGSPKVSAIPWAYQRFPRSTSDFLGIPAIQIPVCLPGNRQSETGGRAAEFESPRRQHSFDDALLVAAYKAQSDQLQGTSNRYFKQKQLLDLRKARFLLTSFSSLQISFDAVKEFVDSQGITQTQIVPRRTALLEPLARTHTINELSPFTTYNVNVSAIPSDHR